MRVLHVSSGNLYGGVETVLVTLARFRHLCSEMQPHFALCFEGRLSEELAATQVPVHQLGQVRTSRPWTVWRARQRLKDLLREKRFDVVVCHMPWSIAIFGPAASSVGAPLVFWAHGVPSGRHWLECWARLTQPRLAICNSRFTAEAVPKLFPHVRREVVYCPAAPSSPGDCRFAVRRELGVPEDSVVIIQVSRMERWKGHLLHLRALSLLKEVPGWICWMVGGAQRKSERVYFTQLQQTAAALGLAGRIRFLGQRSDVPRLLAAADIHCQPNTAPEPFGLTFIEALWAGLPVVTTAVSGAAEIVDEGCGMLAPPGNVTALAALLKRLIEAPDLRRQLGSGGPERARKLSDPRQQLAGLHWLFQNLCMPNVLCPRA